LASGFSPQKIEALSAPLDRALISSRAQVQSKVNYLQSFVVLKEANRIFGFAGWQRQTVSCRCVTQSERLIGESKRPCWGDTYIARLPITVSSGPIAALSEGGTGAGLGIGADLGLAHESAIKGAKTDAMKLALATFGNNFRLALFDKSQRQVSGAPASAQGREATAAPRPQQQ
jgi:recombination DNA repair RAD52 pathway protein